MDDQYYEHADFRRKSENSPVESRRYFERHFESTHDGLSPEARRFAEAIERYRFEKRRQMISYEEIVFIFKSLGYCLTAENRG